MAATGEALSALVNLGYSTAEAAAAVAASADETPGADTATLIRVALRRLAPGG
jgi:holliday junction DNA helicase RuvA